MSLLTPRRRRGIELLDEPGVEPAVRLRSLRDVERANALFGGSRALLRELELALRADGEALTLLDVGTGLADLPHAAVTLARRRGVQLVPIGVDMAHELLVAARSRLRLVVAGDALRLPFADRSVDVVTCSQLLHHFAGTECRRLIAELDRVARRRVIVAELRRSWIAASAFWLVSYPLRFHRVTRHDGTLSVLRGFTRGELRSLVREVTGVEPDVRQYLGWRVTAAWRPAHQAPLAHRPLEELS